jgi:hypothetical protein
MNFTGQVLWKRSVTGAWARTMAGNPSAAEPAAAPPRKRRRDMGFVMCRNPK